MSEGADAEATDDVSDEVESPAGEGADTEGADDGQQTEESTTDQPEVEAAKSLLGRGGGGG